MLFRDLPFAKLRKLLLDLGFTEHVVEGKHLAFDHRESDTFFVFRLYRPQDKVSRVDLAGVRSQLDWHGLLNRDAFDASLRKASA